jgi:beta-mannosidase
LIWFLKDLRRGAGWGVLDSDGRPKLCWYAVRRALAPIALAITDEGTNGLALHLVNETAEPVTRSLELTLWRGGDTNVGRAAREITVPARGAIELPALALFDGFYDLSYAYRFGPPGMQVIHATFGQLDCFWFPAGMPAMRGATVGLVARREGTTLTVSAQQFAQFVAIDLPGWIPDDDGFHLAPGQRRTITLTRSGDGAPDHRSSGTVTALNAEAVAKVELIAERAP